MPLYYSDDLDAYTLADENGWPIGRYWYDSPAEAEHPYLAFYTGPEDTAPRPGMRAFPCSCPAERAN